MQLSLPLGADNGLPRLRDRLIAIHGPQRDELRHDPTAQFVKAMISYCTYDAVSNEAFLRISATLPSWDMLPDSDPDMITDIIQDATHAARKAAHLVFAARTIRARRGRFDLAFLADWSTEDAFFWLDRLPGVGPKIAAATLNFSTLRKRALVVDRHVLRVAKCRQFLPGSADFVRGFQMLMRLVPDDWDADDLYELHWLMKIHSQKTCSRLWTGRNNCPFARLCPKPAIQVAT